MLIDSIVIGSGRPAKLSRINSLVGPSNCGKSTALQDIFRLVVNREPSDPDVELEDDAKPQLLADVEYVKSLSEESLVRGLVREEAPEAGGFRYKGLGATLQTAHEATLPVDVWNVLQRPKLMATAVQKSKLIDLLGLRIAYSDAGSRRTLLQACAATSPIEAPENLLQTLRYADESRHHNFASAYRQLIDSRQIKLDDTQVVSLSVRLATELPATSDDPVANARLYEKMDRLDDQSDGINEVASIVLSMLMSEGRTLLLDDPASHVSPPVAKKLGKWIANNAERLGIQVIVATHNRSFLSGLLSGHDDVTVVPFARRGSVTRMRSMSHDVIRPISRSPFLSDVETVDCLFSQRVIVTQSDEDRAIYQSVAEQLGTEADVTFVHAHGQPNLAPVTQMLQAAEFGVATIADMDLLADERLFVELVTTATGEQPLATWVSTREKIANSVARSSKKAMREDAKDVEAFIDSIQSGSEETATMTNQRAHGPHAAWRMIREQGLDALSDEIRPWAEQLLDELQQKGIFLVPKGQLQGWIDFGGPQSREDWFFNAVNEMEIEECPGDLQVFVSQAVDYCLSRTV